MTPTKRQLLKRNLVLALYLCFAPAWASLPSACLVETPLSGGMRAPLASMVEAEQRVNVAQQQQPKGMPIDLLKQGHVPTPALTWHTPSRTQQVAPRSRLYMIFSSWSLEGG
ncbi:MAG: hypothetical protein AAF267_23045 [Deinococcota bacterium]